MLHIKKPLGTLWRLLHTTPWVCQTGPFLPHLPEALELPLFDTKQLTGLPADNGSVPRCVVQDGLPERRPDSQSANGDCILRARAFI